MVNNEYFNSALSLFYIGKPVGPRFGQSMQHSEPLESVPESVTFTICTNQFRSSIYRITTAKAWNWYLEDGFEEMEDKIPFGIFRLEKQVYFFRKRLAPITFQPDFPETFGKSDKQLISITL